MEEDIDVPAKFGDAAVKYMCAFCKKVPHPFSKIILNY